MQTPCDSLDFSLKHIESDKISVETKAPQSSTPIQNSHKISSTGIISLNPVLPNVKETQHKN